MVVKFTSEMIANPSGGSSGLGFLVAINNLKFKELENGEMLKKLTYITYGVNIRSVRDISNQTIRTEKLLST